MRLAAVHHPNILQFYGVCYERVAAAALRLPKWIVTERQPYSLHAFIRLPGMRELLGLDGAVLLSMDIADGLAHLHGVLGMIHRDLKPKNVLVGPGGGAKLADLGTAKMVGIAARTNQHTVGPGTAIYHPPEVLNGQYTAAIDIFSLGLSIIEIVLAGKWWPGGNQILHLSQRTCITCTTVCDGDSLIGPIIVVQSRRTARVRTLLSTQTSSGGR